MNYADLRVAINVSVLSDVQHRGLSRYTLCLVQALASAGLELCLYSRTAPPEECVDKLKALGARLTVAPRMRYAIWEQGWLPIQLRRDAAHVYHAPTNYGVPRMGTVPSVLTLHDAIDAALAAGRRRPAMHSLRSRALLWTSRRSASHIVTISDYSKRDLMVRLALDGEKITVIYPAAADIFHRAPSGEAVAQALSRFDIGQRRYFLYVGGFEARKNVRSLIRAFHDMRRPDALLVLVGKNADAEELKELSTSLDVSPSVRWLGYVSDSDLAALYSAALSFVYPSYYEGFGLQAAEAMAVGCPVIASSATSLPEVLGDGGILVEPTDTASLTSALRMAWDDPAWRVRMSLRARRRGSHFSWDRTAKETIAVYERCVGVG